MRGVGSLIVVFHFFAVSSLAQVVTLTPASPTADQSVTVTIDATGTPLAGAAKVYMHAGVVTTNTANPLGSDWRFVKGNYGADDGIGQMTAVVGQANKWSITLSPTLRSYFGVPAGTNVFYLAMVFRNANGTAKGQAADIFKPLAVSAFTSITSPTNSDVFVPSGNALTISGTSSEQASTLEILIDSGSGYTSIASVSNGTSISTSYTPSSSQSLKIKIKAVINAVNVETFSTFNILLIGNTVTQNLPVGVKDGINYSSDPTKATLVLLAPNKSFVFLVGDFNNWTLNDSYLMKKTPDGERYWFELTNLTPGQEYVFQYWVDGVIKIGDPLADKVSDPYNDAEISSSIYPNLPVNTRTENGIATVLQTNQTPYAWAASEANWVAPKKTELVVYELLVRDFLGSHSYSDLTDTLNYLKRLGVNAIELMPIMEFEGNKSWGYNPSYFLAPDKYYGTKNALKKFIEKAHEKGIAVILDMVLNHAFGQNPMVRMYFESGKPKNNPWFNPDATHPFSVGYDFNHESQYTKNFVDTVCSYWLKEYHFDGFRFDLSKGFTQTNNPNDVGAWGNYDQSRINILTRMANKIWTVKSDAYVILEHFAASSEELVLAGNGMLLWGNQTGNFANALKGNASSSLEGTNRLSHVNYMESHDEERLMLALLREGQSGSGYNIRDISTALNRAKMGAAFFYTLPGPKMLWQFGELGYDKSINYCEDGTESGNCRTGNKPLPWGVSSLNYYTNTDRQRLYQVVSAINKLVSSNRAVFSNGNFVFQSSGDVRSIKITHPSMNVAIVGNFSTSFKQENSIFTKTGTWFDYFGNSTIQVASTSAITSLAPGEFHIYTTTQQPATGANLVDFLITATEELETPPMELYPNPIKSGKFNIQLEHDSAKEVSVKIFDLTGKELQVNQISVVDKTATVNVNFFPGAYIVSVTDTRTIKYFKILIQ